MTMASVMAGDGLRYQVIWCQPAPPAPSLDEALSESEPVGRPGVWHRPVEVSYQVRIQSSD